MDDKTPIPGTHIISGKEVCDVLNAVGTVGKSDNGKVVVIDTLPDGMIEGDRLGEPEPTLYKNYRGNDLVQGPIFNKKPKYRNPMKHLRPKKKKRK